MPIYEYRCESCAGSFEVLTSFAERDRGQECPSCSSPRTRVLVSTFATAGNSESLAGDMDFGAAGGGCCGGACGCGGSSVN
jgi:putative FmdB family regulatory protein